MSVQVHQTHVILFSEPHYQLYISNKRIIIFHQVFKLIYACRLAEAGLCAQAFHYCEVISKTVLMQPSYYSPVFISQIIQVCLSSSFLSVWKKSFSSDFMFLFCFLTDVRKATILWSAIEGKTRAGMVSRAGLVDWAQAVEWTDLGKKNVFFFLRSLSA